MCTKFKVDVTSTSLKTTLTKNFNQNFNLNFTLSFSMFSGPWNWDQNDASPSEGDDKRLTRVKREPNFLHVFKDIVVDFEKEQANAAARQYSHPQSGKELI